jgi:hypothetical protein
MLQLRSLLTSAVLVLAMIVAMGDARNGRTERAATPIK